MEPGLPVDHRQIQVLVHRVAEELQEVLLELACNIVTKFLHLIVIAMQKTNSRVTYMCQWIGA